MKRVLTSLAFTILASTTFGQNADTVKSNPVSVSDVPPEFIGGVLELMKFINANLVYPENALKNKTEGSVFIEFIIEKDSTLSHLNVLKGIGTGCDEEALRIVGLQSKLWAPGKQKGQPVRVRFVLPVKFVLPKNRR